MSEFTFHMDIHDEGIILVTMTGVFDFDIWRAKRQEVLDTRLAGISLAGRPSIVDVTASDPPPNDWASVFVRLHKELTEVGEGTGPIALVLGNHPVKSATARLYMEIVTLKVGQTPNVICFPTFDEAFRWLMDNDGWRTDIVDPRVANQVGDV